MLMRAQGIYGSIPQTTMAGAFNMTRSCQITELIIAENLSQRSKLMPASFDYKKEYKDLYLPASAPVIIDVPAMTFIMTDGRGDPNTGEEYKLALELLYGLSFTIKMSKKSNTQPEGYAAVIIRTSRKKPVITGFSPTNPKSAAVSKARKMEGDATRTKLVSFVLLLDRGFTVV